MANTVTQIKRIVGRKFSEPGVQTELANFANFNAVEMPNGEVGVEVNYNGEDVTFSSTQILGMLLTKSKQIVAFNNPGTQSCDVVISVPPYFNEAQRRAVRDAAGIAGLHCLRLLNEGTAAALSYGIFKGAKKEFPEGAETKVLFLDMGHSQFTATAAAFTNTSVKVLASCSDSELGGRDIDVAIAKYFAAEFKAKFGIDAWASKKARVKLLMAAEKAKISISPHGVNHTPVSVECLLEDRDFNGALTADKLDELMGATMNARIGAVIAACLKQAGVADYKQFFSVELVGGSSRPRIVKRAAATALGMPLDEANGHGLSQSMNLDEAVARGCALQCAVLSPVFRVKPFDIVDTVPFPVKVSWEPPSGADAAAAASGGAPDSMDQEEEAAGAAAGGASASAASAEGSDSMVIFRPGDQSPLVRRVTFKRAGAFKVTAENVWSPELAAMVPAGAGTALGSYQITGFPADLNGVVPKVRVEFKHDENGLFSVHNAELLREIKDGEADSAKMDTEPAPGAAGEAGKKRRYKRVDLKVEGGAVSGVDAATLRNLVEAEHRMINQDADIRATQDTRNSLEAYIYSTRSALEESLRPFATEADRSAAEGALGDMESWLYGDGFEADKKTYQAKLKELEGKCKDFFARKWESENRYNAAQMLTATIDDFRGIAANRTERHGHLPEADREKMRTTCNDAEAWYRGKYEAQGKLEMTQNPVLLVADINAARERLIKELQPIANRPPPVAAPAPAPAPAAEAPKMDAEPAAAAAAAPGAETKMD
jgi:heat shock protein 4